MAKNNSDKVIKANYTKYTSLINTTKNQDLKSNFYKIYSISKCFD